MSACATELRTRQRGELVPRPKHASRRVGFCHSHDHASPLVKRNNYGARVGGSTFLEVDPVEGGSANDYDYSFADPVNRFDLDGRYSYDMTFDLGRWGAGSDYGVMAAIQANPNSVFPFQVRGGSIRRGRRLRLRTFPGRSDPVMVSGVTARSFTFTTLPGHIEGAGATITFRLFMSGGHLKFRVSARGPDGLLGRIPGFNRVRRRVASSFWNTMGNRINGLAYNGA